MSNQKRIKSFEDEDFDLISILDLKEKIKRQENLFNDRNFVKKLPDQGTKLNESIKELRKQLEKKEEIEKTSDLMSKMVICQHDDEGRQDEEKPVAHGGPERLHDDQLIFWDKLIENDIKSTSQQKRWTLKSINNKSDGKVFKYNQSYYKDTALEDSKLTPPIQQLSLRESVDMSGKIQEKEKIIDEQRLLFRLGITEVIKHESYENRKVDEKEDDDDHDDDELT